MSESLPENNLPLSPDLLLRRAAEGDAARAVELLAYVSPTKLLDAVLTQAELAIDEDRSRPAGIDAIAELDRASIEVMGLPQGADLDLGSERGDDRFDLDLHLDLHTDGVFGGNPEDPSGDRLDESDEAPDRPRSIDDPGPIEASDIVWHPDNDAFLDGPALIGWELTTVAPLDLEAAVLTLPIRPWHLALVAFIDRADADGVVRRQVAAAAADGRLIAAALRFSSPHDDPDVLAATVSRDADDLGELGRLAASLRAALRSAARGVG